MSSCRGIADNVVVTGYPGIIFVAVGGVGGGLAPGEAEVEAGEPVDDEKEED